MSDHYNHVLLLMLPSPPELPNSHRARVVVDVICKPVSCCICLLYCSRHQQFGNEAYSIENCIAQEFPGSRCLVIVLTYHSSCCTNQETLPQDTMSYCSHTILSCSQQVISVVPSTIIQNIPVSRMSEQISRKMSLAASCNNSF